MKKALNFLLKSIQPKWLKILAILLIALGSFSLIKDAFLMWTLSRNQSALESINVVLSSPETVESQLMDVNQKFDQINQDYVAWISIEDTPISYPVVLGEDNAYYLTHDFYQNDNEFGAIFMDYRNHADLSDAHLAIYGHAARYQAMFGFLNEYLNESFLKNHPIIQIQTKDAIYRYQIFAVYVVDASITTLEIPAKLETIQDLAMFYQSQSKFSVENNLENVHQILSLVSCNYTLEDGRIIVQASLIQ